MNNFRKFKNNFLPDLSFIETLFCVIILANSIVALIETIDVWIRKDVIGVAVIDSLDYFFYSVLVITSGIITATFRTLNHILINFIVNVAFILKTYYGYFFANLSNSITFIVLKAIFLSLTLPIVAIWIRRKKKSLFILVAMFAQYTYTSILAIKYHYNVTNPFEILKYLPFPNILSCIIALMMIKGVREESNRIMIVTYLIRLTLYGYYIYVIIRASKEMSVKKASKKISLFDAKTIIEMKIDIVLSIISIFLITITMINSIICHNKFGKGLKDYLIKEELEPFKESYNYKDDLDDYYERT
ncbi:hypothetical protein RhiirA4_486410 [Rhizophagus irregularis]|uniref:Uncharacterized protein n=1 Tax=Rhizophagus irregularis TaxID=588596 RepID=A0A2I1HRL0_9GLOM|nr:hypothetical protein RhiirA4_486410 [Rhizophagus irregularis]